MSPFTLYQKYKTTSIVREHVKPLVIRQGDRKTQLKQRESFWIHKLQASKHPGRNKEIDLVSSSDVLVLSPSPLRSCMDVGFLTLLPEPQFCQEDAPDW